MPRVHLLRTTAAAAATAAIWLHQRGSTLRIDTADNPTAGRVGVQISRRRR